jgi:cholesterol transport system auxiliary component
VPLRQSLRIGRVRVVTAYAAAALVYRTSDVRVIADPYNQLIAEPGALIADKVADWLDQGRVFVSVVHPESSRAADYVLEGTVTELYGDFRPRRTPAAVVTVQFSVTDETGPRSRSVLVRTITRRVDLPDTSPEALVRGYGEALAGILTELTGDLRSVRPRP